MQRATHAISVPNDAVRPGHISTYAVEQPPTPTNGTGESAQPKLRAAMLGMTEDSPGDNVSSFTAQTHACKQLLLNLLLLCSYTHGWCAPHGVGGSGKQGGHSWQMCLRRQLDDKHMCTRARAEGAVLP